MKLSKSMFACAFFLALASPWAGASPLPSQDGRGTEALAAASAPEDVFGASLLSLPADCFAAEPSKTDSATGGGQLDRSTCGACSVAVCRFRPVGWLCGIHSGNPKFCQDTSGDVCEDGGAACRCTDTIVP